MSGPVWDGAGQDPWLPHRLDALLSAETAEQTIYAAIWDALSAWITVTARRVLRGAVPDPDAIWAQVPSWERAISDIITTAVIPVMARVYTEMFGSDFRWDDRSNVITYLTGVHNRLSGIPGETFDLVSGQIAAGVTLGEGIPEIADRVEEVLSTTGSERWPNRSVVIARTETLGALNSSRTDAFAVFDDETEDDLERMWLSTVDTRTRPTHVIADGQRVSMTDPFMVGGFALMFPGDPDGPAKETIQCRCTVLLLEVGETVDLSHRQLKRR